MAGILVCLRLLLLHLQLQTSSFKFELFKGECQLPCGDSGFFLFPNQFMFDTYNNCISRRQSNQLFRTPVLILGLTVYPSILNDFVRHPAELFEEKQQPLRDWQTILCKKREPPISSVLIFQQTTGCIPAASAFFMIF